MHRSLGRQWMASHAEGRLSPWLELLCQLAKKNSRPKMVGIHSYEKLWLNVSFHVGSICWGGKNCQQVLTKTHQKTRQGILYNTSQWCFQWYPK